MKQVIYFMKRLTSFGGFILYANLIGIVFLSLIEGIGIILLVSLISLSGILQSKTGGISSLTPFIKLLQDLPEALSLPAILIVYVLLSVCQNVFQRKLTIRNVRIQTEFIRQLRVETYEALLNANWSFFVKRRKSDLINFLTMEIARVHSGTNICLEFLSSAIFTSVQICFAFWLSPSITVLVVFCGSILSLFSRKYIKKSRKLGSQTSELAQNYLAGITDQMNGIKDIKSNTLEKAHLFWFKTLTKHMVDEQVEHIVISTSSQLFYKIASAILIACFIFLSVKMFNAKPQQFLFIIIIFSRLWPRITGIQSSIEKIASLTPSFKKLMKLQIECKEALETINEETIKDDLKSIPIQNGIECKQAYFRYNQSVAEYALADLNLFIPSKKMTAIVGKSGAGKSTLIDLLMGLLQPEKGQVFLDGIPLTGGNVKAWRRALSYVPQEPFLFNASIRENLLLVEPEANEKQLWEALEFAAAAEFVRKLPQGLDTHIGDRGVRLSGGERQRLVLARAILRKPEILILDEATSALDTENEAKIQEALEKLKGITTIIVIAHRLSTIRNADQVIVLDQGRIVQTGGFSQLERERKGIFSHLLRNQMKASL
ncbi:ABC transporter ATP-binding protein [Neobacillus sp. M.A.Huq-85]